MIETLFILKASCENEEFIKKYILSDHIYRQRLINASKKNPDNAFNYFRQEAAEGVLNRIKQEIEANNIKELRVEELAKAVGMQSYYDTAYRILSNPTHAGVRSLEGYFIFDNQKKITSLNFGPTDQSIELVLITAIDNLSIALASLFEFFKIDRMEEVAHIGDRVLVLKELMDKQ